MILGTAGHIDHGKTALVRALTGVDTDRLPEEKRRGITIDLGFAPLVLDGVGTIGIVDVPGHEGFVRTMLAGASGIDLALLVVAADEGVMPQTREHLEILSLLAIPRAVVALTKRDLVDDDWLGLVREDVIALLKDTALANSEIIPVSSLDGRGIPELRSAISRAASSVSATRTSDDLFRMPIDRAFTVRGTGTVVTGTVWSGEIKRDMTIFIQPGGQTSRVRAIQSHGAAVTVAGPGLRAAIAVADCELADVARGKELLGDREWVPTRELDAALVLTDDELEPTARTRVRLHIGTCDTGARFSRLQTALDGRLLARLILDEPVVARSGDRFVMRRPSPARTIGGGEVLDPYPSRDRRRARPAKGEPPHSPKDSPRGEGRLISFLASAGNAGVALRELPIRTGLTPAQVSRVIEQVEAIVVRGRAWSRDAVIDLEKRIETMLALGMANHPLERGVSLQTVRSEMRAPEEVMDLALDRLEKGGRIELDGSVARPFGWVSRLGERQQALSDAILHEICTHPVEPPTVEELTARFGGSTPSILRWLERDGQLERVSDDRYYGRSAVKQMVEAMRSALEPGRIYSPGELREVLGVSRKYLIPFLEFCDRNRITERTDQGRRFLQ
ncbi:MAG: selenocysteine-specific translation elongation factor [Gemmatimonadales bacterium]